jgi:hypothetical protein
MRRKPQDGSVAQSFLPGTGGRWEPGEFAPDELAAALVHGCVAGIVTSHDRRNVRWKIDQLVTGERSAQFGLTGLTGLTGLDGPSDGTSAPTFEAVLHLMGDAAGFDPDPNLLDGPMSVDPDLVLRACRSAGVRLAEAASRGERVLLATGHPGGLLLLYQATGSLLERHGAKLLEPLDGFDFDHDGHRREIRYVGGVAVYTGGASMLHTHSPVPMELMLAETRPDVVFADHGFAGAAIEAGIDTISIVDVNDPAPVLARALGRTEHVICMDDNVRPEAYWPCFQALASAFPPPAP